MSNIAIIRATKEKLVEQAEAALSKKQDKENPTDKDDEQMDALQTFIDNIQDEFNELESAYE